MSDEELLDKFGVSEEDIEQHEKMKNTNPPLSLSEWFEDYESIDVTFLESEPRTVEVEREDDKGDSYTEEVPVIDVELDGEAYSLWLSSKSLRTSVASVSKDNNGDLEDVSVRITENPAEHEKYGEVAYKRAEQIDETRTLAEMQSDSED